MFSNFSLNFYFVLFAAIKKEKHQKLYPLNGHGPKKQTETAFPKLSLLGMKIS